MLDLGTTAVVHWLSERQPEGPAPGHDLVRPVEEAPEVQPSLLALGGALDAARARNDALLAKHLCGDPVRDDLRGVLAQLGAARMLRVLDWLTESAAPDRRRVLEAVLESDPSGAGQALRAAIQDLNRQALLARIFAQDRLDALLAACRRAAAPDAEAA